MDILYQKSPMRRRRDDATPALRRPAMVGGELEEGVGVISRKRALLSFFTLLPQLKLIKCPTKNDIIHLYHRTNRKRVIIGLTKETISKYVLY